MNKIELQKLQSDLQDLINRNGYQEIFLRLLSCDFVDLPTLNKLQDEFIHGGYDAAFLQRVALFAMSSVAKELRTEPDVVKETPDTVKETPALQENKNADVGNEVQALEKRKAELQKELASLQSKAEEAKSAFANLQSIVQNLYIVSAEDEEEAIKALEKAKALPEGDEKIEAYAKVIALNPLYAEAYYERANYYYQTGEYVAAIQDYNMAILLGVHDNNIYRAKGDLKMELKMYTEAIIDYKACVEYGGNKEECSYFIAEAYSFMQNKEKAMEYLSVVVSLNKEGAKDAKTNAVFSWLFNDEDFKKLGE